MPTINAYAAPSASEALVPTTIETRDVGPTDVRIAIAYAGICHSDIHTARDEWGGTRYPVVPGHEIAGTVSEIGSEVTKYQVGDRVGVGCFVDSCRECEPCLLGQEQYCERGMSAPTTQSVPTENRPPAATPGSGGRRQLRPADP